MTLMIIAVSAIFMFASLQKREPERVPVPALTAKGRCTPKR